jgi:hypothetical protein
MEFEKLCRVSWTPRFSNVSAWARVQFFGRALAYGEAKNFFQTRILPYARPGSIRLTRADFAVDYLTTTRLSPLLVPFDSVVRSWKLLRPQCPYWHLLALNTKHGTNKSPRSVQDYEKDIERVCLKCNKGTGSYSSRKYPEECTDCQNIKINTHVHRCEARIKPPKQYRRSLHDLLFQIPNPFRTHSLIHLGVAPDRLHLLLLAAGRLLGLRELRQELLEQWRPEQEPENLRIEFKKMVDQATKESSDILTQPAQVFDEHRLELQQWLDLFLGILPAQSSLWYSPNTNGTRSAFLHPTPVSMGNGWPYPSGNQNHALVTQNQI